MRTHLGRPELQQLRAKGQRLQGGIEPRLAVLVLLALLFLVTAAELLA